MPRLGRPLGDGPGPLDKRLPLTSGRASGQCDRMEQAAGGLSGTTPGRQRDLVNEGQSVSEQHDEGSMKAIFARLDQLGSSGKIDVLSFLGEQLHAEQSHYWSRWAALAALHAGLLVVSVETSGWARTLTALVGICLTIVWLRIQAKSRVYVERWKPFFHPYRRHQGLRFLGEPEGGEARPKPSTKLAMTVPWALLLPWLVLVVLGLMDMQPSGPL